MKESSGEVKYAQDRLLSPSEKVMMTIAGVLFASALAIFIWTLAAPSLRSDERNAEIAAEAEQARIDRIAEFEEDQRDNAVRMVSRVFYVQDSRTGICFAARQSVHLGALGVVDCAQIPATLLLTTEIE